MLPKQVHLPASQEAKCWDAEVCSRESVSSWDSQARRSEINSQICLTTGKKFRIFMGQRSRVVRDLKEDAWRQGKEVVISVLSRHIWVTCFFMGCMFWKIVALVWTRGFPGGSDSKDSHLQCRRPGSIPVLGRSPGEVNGYPFQYLAWKIPWTEEPGGLQPTGS